jgi:hypothetical protein
VVLASVPFVDNTNSVKRVGWRVRAASLSSAWPTCRCRVRRDGKQLSGSVAFEHVLGTVPLGREDVEGLSAGPTERAGEIAAVEVDHVEYVATLAYAGAVRVRHVGVPDGSFGVDADSA